jgi:MFS superfamily sulfate permease-like transporter
MPPTGSYRTYTEEELQNARTKGQVVGWLQGGAAVALFVFLLGFLGWIPLLALAAVVILLLYFGLKR